MIEVGERGFVGKFVGEVADQADRAELGIGHVEAGEVRLEVEHGAMLMVQLTAVTGFIRPA